MPFSNNRGEGIENKIAEVLARSLGTWVQYYYRPGIERGMTRTTLYADECDVMFDMPSDTERVLVTTPLYRTTFVLASRSDRGITIKNLDDPRLKTLKVGVYQTSAIREALADHDVRNLSIHYLSHDADLVAEDQPAYQVQQVLDGKIDIAAVWGPFAGYYQAMKHAPIALQPVNLMEDAVPLEFDMAVAVRTSDKDLQAQLDRALHAERDAIRSILTQFGVNISRIKAHSNSALRHWHESEDEFIYMLEGTFDLYLDGAWTQAKTGDLVRMPKGLPHAYYNRQDKPARALFSVSPARRLRELFDQLHDLTDPAEVVRRSKICEVDFLPPGSVPGA